jgi:hypothetical protein
MSNTEASQLLPAGAAPVRFRLGGIDLEYIEGTALTPETVAFQVAVVNSIHWPDPSPGEPAEHAAMCQAHRILERGEMPCLLGSFLTRAGEPARAVERDLIRRVLADVKPEALGLPYVMLRGVTLRYYRERIPVLAEKARRAADDEYRRSLPTPVTKSRVTRDAKGVLTGAEVWTEYRERNGATRP